MTIHDGEIIRRSLDHRAAFAELYDRHERVVYRYAARRLGPVHADDIASETFLVAFDRRGDFDGGDDARPWLLGIATRLMQQHARREAKAWRGMLAADLARVDADQFDTVDARLDAGRIARRLGRALARMPVGDRDAILLHTFGDLDYAGIASALGIPIGTVRSRLHRVRRALRTAIDRASGQPSVPTSAPTSASTSASTKKEEPHGRDLAPAPRAR